MQIELNYPEPVAVKLDAAKTMLLIVDMENEDAHPSGKRYMGEAVEEIIPKIVALRRRVSAAGGMVVHTQSVRKPDALEFTLFKNVVRKVEGTWGARIRRSAETCSRRAGRGQIHPRLLLPDRYGGAARALASPFRRRAHYRDGNRCAWLRSMRRNGLQHPRFLCLRACRHHDTTGSERKTSGIFPIHELRLSLQRDRNALRFDRILDSSFVSGPLLRARF